MNSEDVPVVSDADARIEDSYCAASLDPLSLKRVLEALLLASETPLAIPRLEEVLAETSPGRTAIEAALHELALDCVSRGLELKEVAGGYRYQLRADMAPWVSRLWAEKPARLSRALLETLALVVYRQPITRAEIEEIRGVSVGSGVLKTLVERGWVRLVGHREVPGRPGLYGTTRDFLDYFNLKALKDLPPLAPVPSGEMLELPPGIPAESAVSAQMDADISPQGEGLSLSAAMAITSSNAA